MKKIFCVLLFALVSLFFSFPGFAFTVGDVNGDNKISLVEAINAMQVTSGLRSAASSGTTINVPGQVATIQAAINAAAPGDVINVASGDYTESLKIKNKILTIRGAGSNSTTLNGVSGADTLTIDGPGIVSLSGITIQQGNYGIRAMRGAVLEVSDAIVQDTVDQGICVEEIATARLTNVTVQRSGVDGISVHRNASITFLGVVTSNSNTRYGVSISNSSGAFFYGATVTANANGVTGISVKNNAGLLVDSSSISVQNGKGDASNNGRGIWSFSSSSIYLYNNSSLLVENGGYDGLTVGTASSFWTDATSSVIIRTSKRYGMSIYAASSLDFNGSALIENNASTGVNISQTSNFYAYGTTAKVTIKNNTGTGLSLFQGSMYVDPSATLTISGSSGDGISVGQSSSLQLSGTTLVENNAGNGISVSTSSQLSIGGSLLVQNNNGPSGVGIYVIGGSQVYLSPGTSKTVSVQNNKTGIYLTDGSGISSYGGSSITITGNTISDLNIYFNSWAKLPAGSYSTMNCANGAHMLIGGVFSSCP